MLNKHLLVIILLRIICSRLLISSGPISPHSSLDSTLSHSFNIFQPLLSSPTFFADSNSLLHLFFFFVNGFHIQLLF